MPEVRLLEWETRTANPRDGGDPLVGRTLDDPVHRAIVDRFGRRLRIFETRHGLGISAEQSVGAVRIGDLEIRVRPKLRVDDLWHILAYAFGFEDMLHPEDVDVALTDCEIPDLLALLLLREAERLRRRGLRRRYLERTAWTAQPRGRIDVDALARVPPGDKLRCEWAEASTDTPDNRVVRAGLALARVRVRTPAIAARLGRAEAVWGELCARPRLSRAELDRVDRERTRLTAAYGPAHRLVRWIHEGSAVDPDLATGEAELPGALWDMARLFERFVARFLSEHAAPLRVELQADLPHLYRRISDPRNQRIPRPRSDLVVRDGPQVVGVYDTKYRDLWSTPLPRDILYQMSVYALAWSRVGAPIPATVLYPQAAGARPDVVLGLAPAVAAATRIVLRGVDWAAAARMVHERRRSDAVALARYWLGDA